MNTIDRIMQEPMTKEELESKLHILNTLLPNSQGEIYILRLAEKEQIELQLAFFENPKNEDVLVINSYSHQTFDKETIDMSVHHFTSSLYRGEWKGF